MSLKFERKLPIILFFVVVVFTMTGFIFYQNTVSLQEIVNLEKRTQQLLLKLDETVKLTLDLEGGMRGFIVTGNDTYLDPFNRAKQKIPENISQLRTSMTGSQAQLDELDRLEAVANAYVEAVTEKIDFRKREGYEKSIGSIVSAEDTASAVIIRASVDRLKAEELRRLQAEELAVDRNFYRTIWMLIIGSVAGILALGFANYSVSYEIRKRRQAENALIDSNKDLEKRIEDRTYELRAANETLKEVGSERELLLLSEKSSRQEAEIATRLRDEFMATVSHELRTPLNSILGWARMMKTGTLDETQASRALSTIIKNSETQNRLISDLMDVARIISGKLELDHAKLDAAEILADAVESVRPTADDKHQTITFTVDENTAGAVIEGDKDRLMQVFSNLLTNAVKFTPDSGSIDVSAERSDDFFEVRIADNGIGISVEFLPIVFERFRQDTSSTRKNGGLGLGLAIVRNLVELHGGSVSVESEGENKGAEFNIRLPVSKN
jgi:signal transduction histidine kinase